MPRRWGGFWWPASVRIDALRGWLELGLPALTPHTITDPVSARTLLRETESYGYALVDQELEEGVRSVAVPLRGPDGRVVAAVNVSLHAGRTSLQDVPGLLLPALRETAKRITEDIALVFALQPVER